MKTISRITRADWGTPIKSAAYRAAYVVAVLIVAAELVYRAGLAAGRAIHWLSDRLAGLASGRIDRAQTARAVVSWARAVLAAPAAPAAPAAITDVWRARADQRLPVASAAEHEWRKAVLAAPAAPEAAPASLAQTFASVCAASAASDARPYHAVGERLSNIRALLDAAEAVDVEAVVMACSPAATPPVAVAAPPLETLTVAQLRKMASARGLSRLARKGRRADLISALV